MDLLIDIDLKKHPDPIRYGDKIMLVGSCFTEHIGNALEQLKFPVLQNPHGTLFDPHSVSRSLLSYSENKRYDENDLFQLNELWHSWEHHSRFSNTDRAKALETINDSQDKAHGFLKRADWLIITLGSAFSYKLTGSANNKKGEGVANCHRANAGWFDKQLMAIDDIVKEHEQVLNEHLSFNPDLKFIFTVSPVRHIRDGVVENNRSKARLIEAVHYLVNNYDKAFYFPAYELVIDVLRDYRFYDIDLVHPNYSATEFVLEKFSETCIEPESRELMKEVRKIMIAARHRPFQPGTQAHKEFLRSHYEKAKAMQEKYSFLDLKKEMGYFSNPG